MPEKKGTGSRRLSFLRRWSRPGQRRGRSPSIGSAYSVGSDQDEGEAEPVGRPLRFDAPGSDDDLEPLPSERVPVAQGSLRSGESRLTRGSQSTAATSIGSSSFSDSTRPRAKPSRELRVLDSDTLQKTWEPSFDWPQQRPKPGPSTSTVPSLDFKAPIAVLESAEVPKSVEEPVRGPSAASVLSAVESLATKVRILNNETSFGNAPRMAITLAQMLRSYAPQVRGGYAVLTMETSADLNNIVQVVLRFSDILLMEATNRATRQALLQAFARFGDSLAFTRDSVSTANASIMPTPEPRNFALGSSPVLHEKLLMRLMGSMGAAGLAETEGAYVAPILRGLSPQFSVASICIGMPGGVSIVQREAVDALQREACPAIHVYARKDFIRAAGGSGVITPFRVPRDPLRPPMAISVATEDAQYISGTLGGYVYPIVPPKSDLGRHTYVLTSGHVCLGNSGKSSGEQDVKMESKHLEVPSVVLHRLFSKALSDEQSRHIPGSAEHRIYSDALSSLEAQPPRALAEFLWGERTVVDGSLSDVAVARCLPHVQCHNSLGDDIEWSQYDPALILGNLDVTAIATKTEGLSVFKYGSTSKYTSGVASAARIVYWSGGRLQSSEFVVRGTDSGLFASGGDSGAWIYAKNGTRGLIVVGMLHSYDGEYKEFGLYSHIQAVLSRLEQVTRVPWGVVGVPSERDLHEEE